MDSAESANSGLAVDHSEQAQNIEIGTKTPIGSENSPLLPGLPDDIALSCLARVPRRYHSVLSRVSNSWRRLIRGREFRTYRATNGLEEPWIYALCVDKAERLHMYVLDPKQPKRRWSEIHGLPHRCLNRKGVGFEVLDDKIYLFGGCGWVEDATDEVFCYDASKNEWIEGASLPTPRCYFAHEASGGKIYAIGGLGPKSSNTHSIDVFDSSTHSWDSHPDPNVIKDIRSSLVINGIIYIRCGPSAISSDTHVISYEPCNSYTSKNVDADTIHWWCGETVVIGSTLYVLDQNSGVRVMMWRRDSKECVGVRRLSTNIVAPPCRLVAIGEKIVVVGKGLSTVMFDVGCGNGFEGFMVNSSSSLRPVNEDLVLRCKSLAV